MPTLGTTAKNKGLTAEQLALLLRDRESAEANDERGLREIYTYLDTPGNDAWANGPSDPGSESGMGSTGLGITRNDHSDNEGGGSGELARPEFNFDPGQLFRQGITLQQNNQNEGSRNFHYNVDDSAFPRTQFGGVSQSAPVEWNTQLYYPGMVDDDENYGRITDGRNVDSNSWSDYVFPAIMAAMSAGVGGLAVAGGMPLWATQMPALLQAFAQGDGEIPWQRIASMVAGAAGVPGWATTLGNTAYSAYNQGRKK